MLSDKRGILDRLYYEFVGLMFAAIVFVAIISFVSGVQEGTKLQTDFYSRDVANVITAVQAIPTENHFEYNYYFEDEVRLSIDRKNQNVKVGLKKSESSYFFTTTSQKELSVACEKNQVSTINILKRANNNKILVTC